MIDNDNQEKILQEEIGGSAPSQDPHLVKLSYWMYISKYFDILFFV